LKETGKKHKKGFIFYFFAYVKATAKTKGKDGSLKRNIGQLIIDDEDNCGILNDFYRYRCGNKTTGTVIIIERGSELRVI
jgi:hypothetical protein